MSNTVISLKKSSTPAAEPTILANGELAINYADGKLFYKHANGTILPFNTTGGNAFGTVNANGTLVVAGTSEAILTLISGNNISISADAINDTITIDSTGGASVNIGDTPPSTPANGDLWWSSVFGSLFIYYNDSNSAQWVETSPSSIYANNAEQLAIAAFDKANAANLLAYNTGIGANAFASATIAGANVISIAAFNKANTACTNANNAQTIGIAAFDKANNSGVVAIAAFDKANTGSSNALSNTSGVSFNGTLNFPTGNVIVGNTTTNTSISPSSIVSSGSIKLSTPFFESAINVTSDYTISSGYNAMSPGPISINSGVTVTVPSGSVWTVV